MIFVGLWEKEIKEMSDGQIIEFIIKIYNENNHGKNNINQEIEYESKEI